MVLGADIRVRALPADYRWASAMEAQVWETLPDAILITDYGSDIAVPASYPVMYDFNELTETVIDCLGEFGPHSDHKTCPETMDQMYNDPYADYDPMDDIPWGTPDSWIPDNPDDNGMRMSDFI